MVPIILLARRAQTDPPWITFEIFGLTGGTFLWSAEWNSAPSEQAIEVEPSSSATVRVRAKKTKGSVDQGDQRLKLTYTKEGKTLVLTHAITVLLPVVVAIDGGQNITQGGFRIRQLVYRLRDQFGFRISEIARYINHRKEEVALRVANLKVSERLVVVIIDPTTAPYPVEAHDEEVSDSGTFNDTHGVSNTIRNIELRQQIFVHYTNGWSPLKGTRARTLVIRYDILGSNPNEVLVYYDDDNNGIVSSADLIPYGPIEDPDP